MEQVRKHGRHVGGAVVDTDDEDADQASSATASERMTDEENDTDSDEQATRITSELS